MCVYWGEGAGVVVVREGTGVGVGGWMEGGGFFSETCIIIAREVGGGGVRVCVWGGGGCVCVCVCTCVMCVFVCVYVWCVRVRAYV